MVAPAYSPPVEKPWTSFEEDQQRGGPDADLCVAGQEADGEGAGRHQHQGRGEHLLAADLVAEPAEDDAAEGAGDEGGGEGSQQEQGLDGLVRLRQEHRSHGGDQVAEHADVVPFHGVAHDGAAECLLEHRLVHDVEYRTSLAGGGIVCLCCPDRERRHLWLA